MNEKIAILGAGAVGGYVGAALARAGQDVLLVDDWAEHVTEVQQSGLQIQEMDGEQWTAHPPIAHSSELPTALAGTKVDIAIIAVKSYLTAPMTELIKDHLSPDGYALSLQNCINENTIAGILGWPRTTGGIASRIGVSLAGPGRIARNMRRGDAEHIIFRVGEPDGQITPRIRRLFEIIAKVDSAKITANLMGERWTKLSINAMHNAIAAVSGLTGQQCFAHAGVRRFAIELCGESVRVARALGHKLETINGLEAVRFVRAIEGNAADLEAVHTALLPDPANADSQQRPSMGQDILKGRKTEVEDMNGFVAAQGRKLGLKVAANALATDYVLQIEAGKLKQSPDLLTAYFS